MKQYFNKMDEEYCSPLKYHKMVMIDNDLRELKLTEAKRDNHSGYFFCKVVAEVGERGQCGKICKDYTPRNSTGSGLCKHRGFIFEPTNNEFILTREIGLTFKLKRI